MMEQTAIDFSKRPKPGELFRFGSQQYKIYEKLISGGITNVEIQELGCLSHTRRVSDIREKIRPHLLDVKAERIRDGLFIYKLTG